MQKNIIASDKQLKPCIEWAYLKNLPLPRKPSFAEFYIVYVSSFLKLNENMVNKKSILIFNKVPLEKALNKNDVEKWINNATIKANRNNISGKELTPFLIKEINEQSKNETLNANVSLIINNANLAGKIAKSFYS